MYASGPIARAAVRARVLAADVLTEPPAPPCSLFVDRQLPVTCIALTSDDTRCFTGSKDGSLAAWDVETQKRVFSCPAVRLSRRDRPKPGRDTPNPDGHTDEVLAVAVSTDGKFLASGGRDG